MSQLDLEQAETTIFYVKKRLESGRNALISLKK
jgi:hypothetical protein